MITSETGTSTMHVTGARGPRGLDVTLLALGAILLRIPAYLAPKNLGYDDGGYGVAAVAMREGFAPFRDIFSSQGPLFLPLVHLADLAGFETFDAPRLLAVAAGAVTTVAVYFAGRELMDRGRAILAAVLAGSSGVLLWTTGPLTSDGVGAAISVSAVAVALVYRRRPSTVLAIVIAILAGSAFSVKNLLVTPALVTAWLLILSRRRIRDAVLVPLGALVVLLLASLPWGLNDVYLDSIRYHLAKTGKREPLKNLNKLVTTYWSRSLTMVALGLVALATGVVRRFRRAPAPEPEPEPDQRSSLLDRWFGGERILWWWAALVVLVLLAQNPMFRNHLAALVAPFALLVARYRPSWRAVAVTALITVPFQAYTLRPLLLPSDYKGDAATVVDALRKLPDGAWALSDEPGLVWRAGKGTDPFFVDPSVLRIGLPVKEISYDEARLVKAAANPRECAVVVWAPVRFGSFPTLPQHLADLGYEQTEDFGHGRGLWVRPHCTPHA